jgi:ubiquinone biosynthesis protein
MGVLRAPAHLVRLARAGLVLTRAGLPGLFGQVPDLPAPVRLLARLGSAGAGEADHAALSDALNRLGPSYTKLGQFLATRADIIGGAAASRLSQLQDRLEPFPLAEARAEIERAFAAPVSEIFADFGAPVAAASIAQVHEATAADGDGRRLAVKILRPGIEDRFTRELDDFYFAARLAERLGGSEARRLKLHDVVATLDRSVRMEMDLRLEAAAISEMAENTAADPDFAVPEVDWSRTRRRVLTTEWIEGISLRDPGPLAAAGHEPARIGQVLIRSFLRQALRDGFFHADLHPGNLFVEESGRLVAVDFGIMGRLGMRERRFLAEILLGFITRTYKRTAEVHFEAGYVPPSHTVAEFAQALRSIGEPLAGRPAAEISMALLLTQLFEVTRQFDMATRPELLLLQKTMVVAEGVARNLDPELNIWETAEPVVRDFLEGQLSPEGRIQEAAEGAAGFGRLLADLPEALEGARRAASGLARLAAAQETERGRGSGLSVPLWIGATALVVIALALVL